MSALTPDEVFDLMGKFVNVVRTMYAQAGRMPYLVDLDKPGLVDQLEGALDRVQREEHDYISNRWVRRRLISAVVDELKHGPT